MSDQEEQKGTEAQSAGQAAGAPSQPPSNPPSAQPYQPGVSPQVQPGQGVPPQGQPYQQSGQESYQGIPYQGGSPYQGVPPQGCVPPQQPPQGQPSWQPHVPVQQPVKNHQTSSLVLGILSILAALLSPLVAFVLGGIGLAFSSSDRKNFGPQASRAGRICSIVGIVLGVVMWIASFVFLMNTVDPSSILNGAVPAGTSAATSPLF